MSVGRGGVGSAVAPLIYSPEDIIYHLRIPLRFSTCRQEVLLILTHPRQITWRPLWESWYETSWASLKCRRTLTSLCNHHHKSHIRAWFGLRLICFHTFRYCTSTIVVHNNTGVRFNWVSAIVKHTVKKASHQSPFLPYFPILFPLVFDFALAYSGYLSFQSSSVVHVVFIDEGGPSWMYRAA